MTRLSEKRPAPPTAPTMEHTADETQRPHGHSVRDYWTRGTIATLCRALSDLGGVVIELRDERGFLLDAESYHQNQGIDSPVPDDATIFPIQIGEEAIGSVVVHPGDPGPGRDRGLIEQLGEMIALTAGEMCTDVAQLRYRVDEVAVLYRLSSLLVKGGSVEDTLRLSLELALDVLGLDAGAIMLLPEDSEALPRVDLETELERTAAVQLSQAWLENPIPLTYDRAFDRLSLAGKVVTSEDLALDPRVQVPDDCREENLVAFLGTGMVFNGRPIGVIRLYARTRRVFSSAERKLIRSIGESAAAAVEQARLLQMQARQRRTHRALRIAGAIQKRMLPEVTPRFNRIDLAARYHPSQEIGGDFYDLFQVRSQLGVMVGDVVGKGVGAGMLMSAVRATVRAYADVSDDLGKVMGWTNNAVCRDTTVSEFVTIWYAMIDPVTMNLRYVVAGHDHPLLLRRDDDGRYQTHPLPGSGMVVGVLADEEYTMHQIRLQPGDLLVVFTDGITDAVDFEMQRFGKQRLRDSLLSFLAEAPGATAAEALERVFWSMRQFSGLAEQADDETLVVIRIAD